LGFGTLFLVATLAASFWGNRERGSEVVLLPRGSNQAQEHPGEHPQEHPAGTKKSGLSTNDLAEAIQNYVKREAALKGGFFLVYDKGADRTLTLTLERVHRERLSRVAADTYFACADFKSAEGKTYDLDVFMRGPSKDALEVTEISVHKEDGKERYNWVERNGVWSKVPPTK
jgi:hypothetical protein